MHAGCKAILVNPEEVKSKKSLSIFLAANGSGFYPSVPNRLGSEPCHWLNMPCAAPDPPFQFSSSGSSPFAGGWVLPIHHPPTLTRFQFFQFPSSECPYCWCWGWAPPLTRLKWIFGATEGRRPPALSLTMWTLILFICPPLPWWKPFVDHNIFSLIQGYYIDGALGFVDMS